MPLCFAKMGSQGYTLARRLRAADRSFYDAVDHRFLLPDQRDRLGTRQEPNNDRASANAIAHGDVIRGSITRGDEDYFTITLGGTATIDVWTAAAQGGQNMDTYIEMYQEGQEARVAFNDDRGGALKGSTAV